MRRITAPDEFPLIEDAGTRISKLYGMIHPWEDHTRDVRGVFIISPDNMIRSINFYPMDVGRNMQEIKRIVMALQKSSEDNVLVPVNWVEGDDVLIKFLPYSDSAMVANPELAKNYHKEGINMWYKKDHGYDQSITKE